MMALEPNPDAVWMYEKGGLSCKDIAPMFGVSETTVKRWMRSAGVIRTDASKQGRPLQEECGRGHDQSEWRRRTKSGHPYCERCRQIRERKNRGQQQEAEASAAQADPGEGE